MRLHLQRVWTEDAGFVVSIELILTSTIALIGLIAGLSSARDAVISEISDVAGAIQDINQCYAYSGLSGHSASGCGSQFTDAVDFCDDADDTAGVADNCIVFNPGEGEGGDTVTEYTNADNTTDISASQNSTTIKWELEPGQEADADAVTQAILDCIAAGHAAEITWTNNDGESFTFTADSVLSSGPEAFAFSGSSDGSAAGKIKSVTVSCPDDAGGGSGGIGDEG